MKQGIGYKLNDRELIFGDVLKLNFKDILNTTFSGSNLARYLVDEKIDEMYIQLLKEPLVNTFFMKIFYIKDNTLIDEEKTDNQMFFDYLFAKGESLEYIKNVEKEINDIAVFYIKNENTHNDEKEIICFNNDKISDEIHYGDLFKFDVNDVQYLFSKEIFDILAHKKIKQVYCHFPSLTTIPMIENGLERKICFFKVYALLKNKVVYYNSLSEAMGDLKEEYVEEDDEAIFQSFNGYAFAKYMIKKDLIKKGELILNLDQENMSFYELKEKGLN